MKRLSLFTLLLYVFLGVFAQKVQNGYVKTRGRRVNKTIVPGKPLKDVKITITGNKSYISDKNGSVKFDVTALKSFSLVSATLKDYTLADPDVVKRSWTYSALNPFVVVMEKDSQRLADMNEAMRNVIETLKKQLDKKKKELATLKQQNKITEQEYEQKIKELNNSQAESQRLVFDMAERFVSTDYDQLDEYNEKIMLYIEEGELLKADSLIRSKGSIEQRIADYQKVVAANQTERERLEQSEAGAAKAYDDLIKDLYNKYTIAMLQYNWDDALGFLKQRADIDTTNVEALKDYAFLSFQQNKYSDAEKYFFMILHVHESKGDIEKIADTQHNLGLLYSNLHEYAKSEKYFLSALQHFEQLYNQNPDAYRKNLASSQNSLGGLYSDLKEYTKSEKYYLLALQHFEQLYNQNHDAYRKDLAMIQNNLGLLYSTLHKYTKSEKHYLSALQHLEQLYNQNPDAYRKNLATTQNNLGGLYSDFKEYTKSENLFLSALEHREQLFAQNPDAYREDFASVCHNLGNLYSDLKEYTKSENLFLSALQHFEQLYNQNPDAYCEYLSSTLNDIAILYRKEKKYKLSEHYFQLALEHNEKLYAKNPEVYRVKLAKTQKGLGILYKDTPNLIESERLFKLALNNFEQVNKQFREKYLTDIRDIQYFLATVYDGLEKYTEAEEYYEKAKETAEVLFEIYGREEEQNFLAHLQYCLGLINWGKEDYDKSEIYLTQSLENYNALYALSPEEYRFNLTLVHDYLGKIYWDKNDFAKVKIHCLNALEHYEVLYAQDASEKYKNECIQLLKKIAFCYRYEFNNDASLKMMDKAISYDIENPKLYEMKGQFLVSMFKYNDALEMWHKVLELDPNYLNNNHSELFNSLKEKGLVE